MCLAISPIFVSLAKVNGFTAAFYRVTIAAAVLLIPYLLKRKNSRSAEHSRPSRTITVLIAGAGGLIFALNNGFFNTAVTMVPVANAVFLVNTSVIWVGLVSMFVFREKLSINFWLGVALALAGVFLITNEANHPDRNLFVGNLIALLSGVFYAGYILINNKARVYLSALSYMVFSSISSSIILFVTIVALGIPYTGFSLATYGYLFGLGFVSHALGFFAIVYAQAHIRPSTVSTMLLAQPLAALTLAFLILREQPSSLQLVGMLILLVGIYLANKRRKGLLRA
jgi:drug/metabolite transporter (DMT)-like permease